MKRTEAQRAARMAAERKDISFERLTNLAISSGVFIKPGTNENYSLSWIIGRLRLNDMKIAEKLVKHSTTI